MKSASFTTISLIMAVLLVFSATIGAITFFDLPQAKPVILGLVLLLSMASLYSLWLISKMKTILVESSNCIGQVIKANLDQRIAPVGAFNEIGVLQHRLNNLFDILDVTIRNSDALIDPDMDGDYYHKITGSPLRRMLIQNARPEVPVAAQTTVAPPPSSHTPLHETIEMARRLVQQVTSLTIQMHGHCQKLTSQANDGNTAEMVTVIESAQRARSNVETVAAAAEELSYAISEISGRVHESSHIASQAVEHAKKSNAIMNGLNKASDKIGDVVKLITDIAGQTNLLALNATIEAARAGEAGRGFAVVASEVKSLADQTAKATEEISDQINTIQQSTGSAVKAIQEISKTIERISEISTAIAAAVEEQSAATNEISRNIQMAAQGTVEVAEAIETMGEKSDAGSSNDSHGMLQLSNQILEHMGVLDAELNDHPLKKTA
jgi:uncharacterized protein YoxC